VTSRLRCLQATKCLRNGALTCSPKFISSFHVLVSDRTRLRKPTTAQTQTLCASRSDKSEFHMSEFKNDLIRESFNEDFCAQLEYHLTRTFGQTDDKNLKGFWCDGVLMPTAHQQLTKKNVKDKRKIVTKAWLGFDGQGEYEMTINLGQHSLSRYQNGTDLFDCLQSEDMMDWISLDMKSKTIELQLK
jgi:hypothetical protein